MKKIGYGIVGFGGIAENRIAKEGFGLDKTRFDGHPDAELLGATDIDQSRADAATALHLKWYASAEELLKEPRVDAVFIATNNRSHAPLAEQAIKAGKHCIVEKPFATTLQDCLRIQDLAHQNAVSIAVDHMMMDNVYNIKARELVKHGSIGEVNDICLHMEFLYGSTPEEAATWRCADPSELGGPIGDVASHCLYMAEFLLDSRVESLACVYIPKTLDIKVENGAFIQFKLQNQVQGTIRAAFNQPRGGLTSTLANLGYEVYGTEGTLRGYGTLFQLSGHKGEPVDLRLELDRSSSVETIRIEQVQNIYQAVISRHARSIISNKPLDAAEAIQNLRLILACHESARDGGRTIEL